MRACALGPDGLHPPRLLAVFLLLVSTIRQAHAQLRGQGQVYTTNALCLRKFCVNPIVPGLMHFGQNALTMNENRTWACAASSNLWRRAGICQRVVVGYAFSVPEGTADGEPATQADMASAQASQALAAFVAHLAGMGFDFWEYTEPWMHDECIQSVWKMACYTYFPSCNVINSGRYLRPCASSCQDYLKKCKVECCDDGVQCVFRHARQMPNGQILVDEGYADHAGPSPLCTGGASSWRHLWIVTAASAGLLHALALPA